MPPGALHSCDCQGCHILFCERVARTVKFEVTREKQSNAIIKRGDKEQHLTVKME